MLKPHKLPFMEAEQRVSPLFVLTARALAQVRLLLQTQGVQSYCLEVHARPAACKEMEYELGLVQTPSADQLCWQQEDIQLCVSLQSARYLLGASLDFVENAEETGFKFTNPYVPAGCDCESPHSGRC